MTNDRRPEKGKAPPEDKGKRAEGKRKARKLDACGKSFSPEATRTRDKDEPCDDGVR